MGSLSLILDFRFLAKRIACKWSNSIAEAESDAAVLAEKIAELDQEIAAFEADKKAATEVRAGARAGEVFQRTFSNRCARGDLQAIITA